MADLDAEQAFLNSMQEGSEASTATAASPNVEGTEAVQPTRSESHPQTIGGFIVDDEDDDDEDDDNDDNEDDEEEDEEAEGTDVVTNEAHITISKTEETVNKDNDKSISSRAPNSVERASSSTPLPSQRTLTNSFLNSLSPRASTLSPSHHQNNLASLPSQFAEHGNNVQSPAIANINDTSTVTATGDGARASVHAAGTPTQQVDGAATEKDTSATVTSFTHSENRANSNATALASSVFKARLPNDRVGLLEDRIAEDPKGDIEAWTALISEHKKRNKSDEVRKTYDRFFKIFPSASGQWVEYANWELEQNEFYRVEQIFTKSLTSVLNLQLWSLYLNYVRRRNNITTDPTGNARQVVSQTYDVVLEKVGIDRDAGQIWSDYIQFVRSGPGQVGGASWQDQQKMDLLRKTYQRAICIPTASVNGLWREYDAFEMDLNKNNKATARQFLQQKSPAHMTARAANTNLQSILHDLDRSGIPKLPPAPGFEGDVEYAKQVQSWKKWIEWEKDDPLAIQEEDSKGYKDRILYVYKQAVLVLRFYPEMWFEAAEFCFRNGLDSDGTEFLSQGAAANPESTLLAFRSAERIESTTKREDGDEKLKRRGELVREPFDTVLNTLYGMIKTSEQRENEAIARIKEDAAQARAGAAQNFNDEDEEEEAESARKAEAQLQAQIDALRAANDGQTKLLHRTLSFVWIALMRAMRRVQGKGKVGDTVGGSRQIFTDARKRGRILSEVYVAAALIEYHCYKDPAASKIFERGMKLFPTNEEFAVEYVKHLVATNDIINARAVFESAVSKLTAKPENVPKSKILFEYLHQFESAYGELSQIHKVEQRMKELFPDDPQLKLFSQRHSIPGFDPTSVRLIVSPLAQTKPKTAILPTIEGPASVPSSSRAPSTPPMSRAFSPKRPLEDSDNESYQPRKVARPDSPLKGAAGRRLDAAKRSNLRTETMPNGTHHHHHHSGSSVSMPQPQPLPSQLNYILSIIPAAHTYNATRFNPSAMINLIRNVDPGKAILRHVPTPTPQPAPGQLPQYSYPGAAQPPPSTTDYPNFPYRR